jgi:hypothetical protein
MGISVIEGRTENMNGTERVSGLENGVNATRRVGKTTRKAGALSAVLAIVLGIVMIATAILLSNTFTGSTHVNEPIDVVTVESTYPTADMYAGESFTFYINWTANHDVKDVVLCIEIVKPDVNLTDTSVTFAWWDGTAFVSAPLTDTGSAFTLQSGAVNADSGASMSYLVQMTYHISGDWVVHFTADGSLA